MQRTPNIKKHAPVFRLLFVQQRHLACTARLMAAAGAAAAVEVPGILVCNNSSRTVSTYEHNSTQQRLYTHKRQTIEIQRACNIRPPLFSFHTLTLIYSFRTAEQVLISDNELLRALPLKKRRICSLKPGFSFFFHEVYTQLSSAP